MLKVKIAMIMALLMSYGVANAQQVKLTPFTAFEMERMKSSTEKVSIMLSACGSNVPLDVIKALISTRTKATIFLSGEAVLHDSELRRLIKSNLDLFEVGNLGHSCWKKKTLAEGLAKSYFAKEADQKESVNEMKKWGESVVLGSYEVAMGMGVKPKFYAFGADFESYVYDPFDQQRLIAGLAEYLKKPMPGARYDVFALSKAGFGARVMMEKMDRKSDSIISGKSAYSQSSFEGLISKNKVANIAKKASEVWLPAKRAKTAKEMELELSGAAER
jgi:hypothetical protein